MMWLPKAVMQCQTVQTLARRIFDLEIHSLLRLLHLNGLGKLRYSPRPGGYKTFLMLNSAEHENVPVIKSQITNNCTVFLAKHSLA